MKKLTKNILIAIGIVMSIFFAVNFVIAIVNHETTINDTHFFYCFEAIKFVAIVALPFIFEKLGLIVADFIYLMFIAFYAGCSVLGEICGLYYSISFWDSILHFSSGILLTTLGISLATLLNKDKKVSPFFIIMFGVMFTISVGVVWEIYEFFSDAVFGTNMQRAYEAISSTEKGEALFGVLALTDTMKDLILDTAGATLTGIVVYVLDRKKVFSLASLKLIYFEKNKEKKQNQISIVPATDDDELDKTPVDNLKN